MTPSSIDHTLVRAALATSDEEYAALEAERTELAAMPADELGPRGRNRLRYVEWTLDRLERGRSMIEPGEMARLRSAAALRAALDDFYAAAAVLPDEREVAIS